MADGTITQVMGPVVDVEFPPGDIPEIYTALTTSNPSIDEREGNLTFEVALHLGENTARCIAFPRALDRATQQRRSLATITDHHLDEAPETQQSCPWVIAQIRRATAGLFRLELDGRLHTPQCV